MYIYMTADNKSDPFSKNCPRLHVKSHSEWQTLSLFPDNTEL